MDKKSKSKRYVEEVSSFVRYDSGELVIRAEWSDKEVFAEVFKISPHMFDTLNVSDDIVHAAMKRHLVGMSYANIPTPIPQEAYVQKSYVYGSKEGYRVRNNLHSDDPLRHLSGAELTFDRGFITILYPILDFRKDEIIDYRYVKISPTTILPETIKEHKKNKRAVLASSFLECFGALSRLGLSLGVCLVGLALFCMKFYVLFLLIKFLLRE